MGKIDLRNVLKKYRLQRKETAKERSSRELDED